MIPCSHHKFQKYNWFFKNSFCRNRNNVRFIEISINRTNFNLIFQNLTETLFYKIHWQPFFSILMTFSPFDFFDSHIQITTKIECKVSPKIYTSTLDAYKQNFQNSHFVSKDFLTFCRYKFSSRYKMLTIMSTFTILLIGQPPLTARFRWRARLA